MSEQITTQTTTTIRQAIRQARTQVRELSEQIATLQVQENEAAKKLERAEKKGLRSVDTWQATVNGYATDLAAKQQKLAEAKSMLEILESQQSRAQRARDEIRDAAIVEQFGRTDLYIRFSHSSYGSGSTYELHLLQTDAAGEVVMKTATDRRTGETYTYPEQRFGMDVTVYGPRYEVRDIDPVTKALKVSKESAQVNWGSMGALDLSTAQELVELHQLAIRVAQYLNEQAETWAAEDDTIAAVSGK